MTVLLNQFVLNDPRAVCCGHSPCVCQNGDLALNEAPGGIRYNYTTGPLANLSEARNRDLGQADIPSRGRSFGGQDKAHSFDSSGGFKTTVGDPTPSGGGNYDEYAPKRTVSSGRELIDDVPDELDRMNRQRIFGADIDAQTAPKTSTAYNQRGALADRPDLVMLDPD